MTFTGADPIGAAEKFYAQSEQRGARYFQLGEESFALVSEHSDCDLAWFHGLAVDAVRELEKTETPRRWRRSWRRVRRAARRAV